jgi:hypothetical protein
MRASLTARVNEPEKYRIGTASGDCLGAVLYYSHYHVILVHVLFTIISTRSLTVLKTVI